MQQLTDTQLRELARKRVGFRTHLVVYLIVNTVLWILWYITGQGYIWPVWPMAMWGIGLLFNYLFDYRPSTLLSEEEEYQRLKRETGSHEGIAH